MTGTAIPAIWRTVRPSAMSCAVLRQAKPSTTELFRHGGRPRVPG